MKSFDELILEEDRLYDNLRRTYGTIHALTETALGEEFFATTPTEHEKKLRSLTDLVTAITHLIEQTQDEMRKFHEL